ncbi:MAG: hypothetical protein C4551_10080 [Bacillota bacterium]|jgi:hypothetical protein|nr:MAG: hypothetical protein C4551_10080 [Bacillota bacterium]
MAGETWRGLVQFGKEVAYGTPVAATRRMYFRDPKLTREREPRIHKFLTASRQTTRNLSLGPTRVGGTLVLPMSAEILELLEIGLKGGVTGQGAGATKTWTYTPGDTLDSATVEWHDGARAWQAAGVYADSLKIAGSIAGENLLTGEVFGKAMIPNAHTGGLTDRVPAVFEGWESKMYIDAFGAAPGGTNVANTLLSWDVSLKNNLKRKYFGDNTLNAGAMSIGEVEVEAKIGFEASPAAALTEYNNWDAATKRIVRLEFGNNALIGAGPDTEKITVDIPGAWKLVDLGGEDEGTRTYELTLHAVYDPTNTYMLQVIVTTARTTVFA